MLYEASREIEVRADATTFFDVVCDFARYPEFVSGVGSVEVLERAPAANGSGETGRALVCFGASLLGVPFRYVLECVREGDRRVRWRRTAGSFRDALGAWTVLETRDERIVVRYENAVDPGVPVPGFIVRFVLERQLPKLMEEMRGRVETAARARAKEQRA